MNARFFPIFLLTCLSVQVWAQSSFETAVQQLLQKPEYKNASVGMHVVDLSSGEKLYALNPEKLLIPASTMKLITSASAFEILGANYCFETKVAYQGKIDEKGILNGDLVVIGGADPALGSEYFQNHYIDFLKNWTRKIKASGIKTVKGNLILDASVFGSERVPDTWIWSDIGNYYGAGPNAFTVYDNMFRITFRSPKKVDKLTTVIATTPHIEGMEIINEVRSADNSADNAYVFGGAFDKTRIIRGTIPRNRKAFTIKAAIHQPEEIFAHEFITALAKEGVFVSGDTRFEKVNKKAIKTLFVQQSPTVAEIAEVLNHESVNLFAEHLLKQFAAVKTGTGDRAAAIDIVKEYWESKGISSEFLYMEDGSGLSHFNAVSPTYLTQLLSYMATNRAFVNSLPNAGEGSLKRFNSASFPDTTLQAKSGSMTRVRCYSGYLKTDSGKTLVFSFMFNHNAGSNTALIKEIEQLFVLMKRSM